MKNRNKPLDLVSYGVIRGSTDVDNMADNVKRALDRYFTVYGRYAITPGARSRVRIIEQKKAKNRSRSIETLLQYYAEYTGKEYDRRAINVQLSKK